MTCDRRPRRPCGRPRAGSRGLAFRHHLQIGSVVAVRERLGEAREVEEAFKNLKGDLAIRPIFHQLEARIEAHIFIAFVADCLHVTLARRLRALAPGLTPRSVLEQFATLQMIDVHVPTTDGRELLLTRYTQPARDVKLLLDKLKLKLPAQPPPKISAETRNIRTHP